MSEGPWSHFITNYFAQPGVAWPVTIRIIPSGWQTALWMALRMEVEHAITEEMAQLLKWCDDNYGEDGYTCVIHRGYFEMRFFREEDALLFKIVHE